MVHGKSVWFMVGIIDVAEQLLNGYKAANMHVKQNLVPFVAKRVPHSFNLFKVNFDASWINANASIGIGVGIRDQKGIFYVGMSKVGRRVKSAEAAEYVVARKALAFVIEAGF